MSGEVPTTLAGSSTTLKLATPVQAGFEHFATLSTALPPLSSRYATSGRPSAPTAIAVPLLAAVAGAGGSSTVVTALTPVTSAQTTLPSALIPRK